MSSKGLLSDKESGDSKDQQVDASYFCADGIQGTEEADNICRMLSWPSGQIVNLAEGNGNGVKLSMH